MPLLSCQMFTLYLPPTIVVSYRGIEDSIRHHTYSLDGQLSGEPPFGSRNFPAAYFVSVISEEIRTVFDRAASGREAARFLAELRQGDRSVTDFLH